MRVTRTLLLMVMVFTFATATSAFAGTKVASAQKAGPPKCSVCPKTGRCL